MLNQQTDGLLLGRHVVLEGEQTIRRKQRTAASPIEVRLSPIGVFSCTTQKGTSVCVDFLYSFFLDLNALEGGTGEKTQMVF
jgi:hypothetical protein